MNIEIAHDFRSDELILRAGSEVARLPLRDLVLSPHDIRDLHKFIEAELLGRFASERRALAYVVELVRARFSPARSRSGIGLRELRDIDLREAGERMMGAGVSAAEAMMSASKAVAGFNASLKKAAKMTGEQWGSIDEWLDDPDGHNKFVMINTKPGGGVHEIDLDKSTWAHVDSDGFTSIDIDAMHAEHARDPMKFAEEYAAEWDPPTEPPSRPVWPSPSDPRKGGVRGRKATSIEIDGQDIDERMREKAESMRKREGAQLLPDFADWQSDFEGCPWTC